MTIFYWFLQNFWPGIVQHDEIIIVYFQKILYFTTILVELSLYYVVYLNIFSWSPNLLCTRMRNTPTGLCSTLTWFSISSQGWKMAFGSLLTGWHIVSGSPCLITPTTNQFVNTFKEICLRWPLHCCEETSRENWSWLKTLSRVNKQT